MAIFITALLGLAGLGVEPGSWYALRRQQQTAADFAAVSGAMEIAVSSPDYQSATTSGFAAWHGGTRREQLYICLRYLPERNARLHEPGFGADVRQQPAGERPARRTDELRRGHSRAATEHIFRQSLLSQHHLSDRRAVAGVEIVGSACTIALNSSAPKAIDTAGNTTLSMNGCGRSNSTAANSVNFQGSATLNASWFESSGSYNTNGNPNINVPLKLNYTQPVADPYSCSPPTPGCAGTINWTTVDTALNALPARTFTCGRRNRIPLLAPREVYEGRQ